MGGNQGEGGEGEGEEGEGEEGEGEEGEGKKGRERKGRTWGGRGGPGKEGEDLGRNERGVGGTAVNHEAGNLTVIPISITQPLHVMLSRAPELIVEGLFEFYSYASTENCDS